ncbi:lipopolysaccharide kinase InaA family protein [Pseudomonas aeruginosa]|uniref:lipopolysaccharide kinase InaA family protein n=1 Tax=Pseudomonas aeruginosa TaxID=287 RepID=UPI0039838CF1
MAPDLASLQRISGDSAIDQWLQVPGSWVEEPNERRGGASGVQRVYTGDGRLLYRKQQTGHVYRDWQRPFGYPTAMRERDALRAFESLGIRVPRLIYSGCRKVDGQWQALLVTEALEGFSSLDECYARGDQDRWGEAKHQRILQQIGATIARMNLAHWQHGCLYPKHIFVRVEGEAIEVALIDLEKSRLTVNKASQHDLKQLKRRSSWTGAQWQAFIYGYQTAFGSAIKGLQT